MEITNGLILKQSNFGEGNRMLTIFTEDFGIVKAAIYDLKRAKSRQSAASQFLSFSEFNLYFGKGEVGKVNNVTAIENFFPIHEDIQKLALSNYLAEITCFSQSPNARNTPMLRTLLNTFYALAYCDVPIKKAKSVYELKIADDMGYRPVLEQCIACGCEEGLDFFSSEHGGVICRNCHSGMGKGEPFSKELHNVIAYVLSATPKRIFSFQISEKALDELSVLCEKYLLNWMERGFESLDYLKNILT